MVSLSKPREHGVVLADHPSSNPRHPAAQLRRTFSEGAGAWGGVGGGALARSNSTGAASAGNLTRSSSMDSSDTASVVSAGGSPPRPGRGGGLRVRCTGCGAGLRVPAGTPAYKTRVKCVACGTLTPLTPLTPDAPPANAPHAGARAADLPAMRGEGGEGVPPGPPIFRVVGPTSPCLRETVASQGFVRDDARADWCLAWGCTLAYEEMERMGAFQRHNHIPGWDKLNNKGVLGEMAELLRQRRCGLALNVPDTFVLPQHAARLAEEAAAGGGPYVLKPVGGTRGRGIRVVRGLSREAIVGLRGKWVCQRYLASPNLIQGRKYDLRLYVAATSADPLRLYIHREGYARLCSETYDASLKAPDELYRHVTNSSFQKQHGRYDLSEDSTPERPAGNKWHIDAVRREWRRQGCDDKAVWGAIEDALTRVFLMFEAKGCAASSRFVRGRHNCFCLFGVDVLIDAQMQPWVLELNGVPSTGTESPLDVRIKSRMLGDLLSLLGLCSRDPGEAQRDVQRELMRQHGFPLAHDALRGGEPPPAGRVPTESEVRARLERRGYRASDVDVRVVLEGEEEMGRRRGWERCYPCAGMGRYFPLLEGHRHNNELMLKFLTSNARV